MSNVCDTCRDPGHCCKNFPLNISAEKYPTVLDVMIAMASIPYENPDRTKTFLGFPFLPEKRNIATNDWTMNCVNLLPNGRCGDYENRPYGPCVMFEPKSGMLCIEWPGHIEVPSFV